MKTESFMKRAVMALAILGLVLVLGTRAEAALATNCSAPGGFHNVTVTGNGVNDGQAADLAARGGYNNADCNLTISVGIPGINTQQFILLARNLIIGTGLPITIQNGVAGGEIVLISEGASQTITILNATIWALSVIKTVCNGSGCIIKVDGSSIVAANPLGATGPTSTTGELFFSARSHIDINTSTIWGGAGLHIASDTGHVVFICLGGGGGGVCTDPLTSGVVQALCPTGFPCPVTFPNAAALRAVCFPSTPGVVCGGGSKEIRIFAFLFVDITGTTLTVLDHISIESATEDVRAANSTIDAEDAINISARTTVNMQNATWTARRIRVQANCVGAPLPNICINANGADLEAVEVIGIDANNAAGIITVCNAASLDVPLSNPVVLNGGVCNFPPGVPPGVSGAGPNTKVTATECVGVFGNAPAALCR